MQLGWIDFSKEDRQKALDVINLLSEQGAVDELGIGIIRDAFANYFFPGTSTPIFLQAADLTLTLPTLTDRHRNALKGS